MLYCIGLLFILNVVYEILKELYKMLQPFPNIQQKYGKDCWAVVTGATDGIGKGYCQILAQQNVNICMIVRNQDKAEELIKELSKSSTSKFKIVIADFQNSNQDGFFDKIYSQIDQLDIGLLINNVGVAISKPLQAYKDEEIKQMIIINCFPVVLLTKKLIPLMEKRKRSGIINLSSMAGRVPIVYNQVYSGTKAFDDFFSRSLALELNNIDVLSHRPCYVTTAMTHYVRGNGAISPIDCAKGGLQRLSLEYASHGHWNHRLQGLLMGKLIPDRILNPFIKKQMTKLVRKLL